MSSVLDRTLTQPLCAWIAGIVALASFSAVGGWTVLHGLTVGPVQIVFLFCLAGAVALSYRHPIHLRHNHKLYMGSVPLYLLAVLLPPAPAGLAAVAGILAGEIIVRPQRGSYWSDIATQTGRWLLLGLIGSLVAHLPLPGHTWNTVALFGAGFLMWLGDMITVPLVLSPMMDEPAARIIRTSLLQGGIAEGAQYLVGLLGALVAQQNAWALVLLALPTVLVYLAFKSAKELHDSTRQILERMADTVDLRDPYTGGHSRRVTDFSAAILRELEMTGPEVDLIIAAARVHDIGKIGIPDGILNKPDKLTDEEWAIMATHSERGAELLAKYPDFARGVEIVRHHHESWDGSGYPYKLRGKDIPLGARVIAVADSYDAMTSDRPYRRGMTMERATQILREGRGRQWDPVIVDAFIRYIQVAVSRGELHTPVSQTVPEISAVGSQLLHKGAIA